MSLKKELSENQKYYKALQKSCEVDLTQAALAILRQVIAPMFRQMHYGGYQKSEKLMVTVFYNKETAFTIMPSPQWNFSHRGVDYRKKYPYGFLVNASCQKLWEKVAELAQEPEWELQSKFNEGQGKTVDFILNLADNG